MVSNFHWRMGGPANPGVDGTRDGRELQGLTIDSPSQLMKLPGNRGWLVEVPLTNSRRNKQQSWLWRIDHNCFSTVTVN